MKSPALLLAGSLLANAALVALFAFQPTFAPPAIRGFFVHSSDAGAPTSTTVSAQPAAPSGSATSRPKPLDAKAAAAEAAVWQSLHPEDLKGLIAKLRDAGFPPSVIRSVIQTLISARFAPRMREVYGVDESVPYWRQRPGYLSSSDTKRMELNRQISSERSKLMRELFSDDFFNTNGDATAAQRRQYGDIPRSKIDLLERINEDYNDLAGQIRAAMGGITLPEDREKLALLEREKHADLAAILTPAELADYEMRTSSITSMLRSRLGAFDLSESEFRALYQVQKAISDQFAANGGMQGINFEIRRSLGEQYVEQMKAALGPERFAEYNRAQDRDYQQLTALGQRENIPVQTLQEAFAMRDTLATESNRIFADPALTADQKRAALATLAQQTRNQLLTALGPTVGPAYLRTAENWLRNVESGSAVSFDGPPTGTSSNPSTGVTMFMGGSSPTFKRVPMTRPPGAQPFPPPANSGAIIRQ